MQVTLLAFSSAAQKLGWRERQIVAEPGDTPRTLFARVAPEFDPAQARAAVNCEYHDWDAPIRDTAREVAIIPPVSGG